MELNTVKLKVIKCGSRRKRIVKHPLQETNRLHASLS